MPTTKDELLTLIESSLSVSSLDEKSKADLKERLLNLPEKEMQDVIEVFRQEQKEQYESMKGLVQQIEEASRNLKKTFLIEREKDEKKDSDAQADNLMDKLDGIS